MMKYINGTTLSKSSILIGMVIIHFFIFHEDFSKEFPKLEFEYKMLFYGFLVIYLIFFNGCKVFTIFASPYVFSLFSYWALSVIGHFKYHIHSAFDNIFNFILISLFYPYLASSAWFLTILLFFSYIFIELFITSKKGQH